MKRETYLDDTQSRHKHNHNAIQFGLVVLVVVSGCDTRSGLPTAPQGHPPTIRTPTVFRRSGEPSSLVAKADEKPRRVPGLRRDFDSPLRASLVATGDPELDPLVAYLKESFSAVFKDGHQVVINEITNVEHLHFKEPYEHLEKGLLAQASDQVPADLIRDFLEKNRKPHRISPELTRYLPATLLTHSEKSAIFSDQVEDGWKNFYAKYPTAYAIITVSRVGVNPQRTLAMFYMAVGEGSRNGHGQIHILKKVDDAWIELPIDIGVTWMAGITGRDHSRQISHQIHRNLNTSSIAPVHLVSF